MDNHANIRTEFEKAGVSVLSTKASFAIIAVISLLVGAGKFFYVDPIRDERESEKEYCQQLTENLQVDDFLEVVRRDEGWEVSRTRDNIKVTCWFTDSNWLPPEG